MAKLLRSYIDATFSIGEIYKKPFVPVRDYKNAKGLLAALSVGEASKLIAGGGGEDCVP